MNRETLSALFDGECKGKELDQLLAELDRDPALHQEWSRLCVARQAVQGRARRHDEALTRNIMAAVVRDAATPAARAMPRVSWNLFKPLTGYALAAAVGAVAVFGVMPKANQPIETAGVEVAAASVSAQDPFVNDHQNLRARQRFGGSLRQVVYSPVEGSY